MLPLNATQVQALQALQRSRHLALLADTIASSFPELAKRLGERHPLLIELGAQRGSAHGLVHLLCLARYIACWCALGAEFETKPGFEWAATLLGQRERGEGIRVFQLCRRSREELGRLARLAPPPAGLMTLASFDAALAQLDATLRHRGALGALLPGPPLQLGEPCDIDALELHQLAPVQFPRYALADGQWQLGTTASQRQPVVLQAGVNGMGGMNGADPAAADGLTLPPQLWLLAGGDGAARLRIRTAAQHCCDASVHPALTLHGPHGIHEWRGREAAVVELLLHPAPASPPPADACLPALGAETPPQFSSVDFASCGMREDGPALGSPGTQLAVLSAEQHLLAWQRGAGPEQMLSSADDAAAAAAPAWLRVERDGVALDASRWRAGLADLDRQLQQALARLHSAWERESGVEQAQLRAQPRLLAGQTALTWGWAEAAEGLRAAPYFRICGQIEWIACQLDLLFSGALALRGSRSRIELHCNAAARLSHGFERRQADADIAAALAGASTKFTLPLAAALQSMAGEEACVVDLAGPPTGAIVGGCGLRPRPDGQALQWFLTLAVEPVAVWLHWHDPLLGQQRRLRPLLPELKLIDWSLG